MRRGAAALRAEVAQLALGWDQPPDGLVLGLGEVHVWAVDLDAPDHDAAALKATLSPVERERAGRFRFARDQRRYVVRRGLLRAILGHALGVSAGEVALRYGHQGKPALAEPAGLADVRFNLSDSEALAVYAVTLGVEVGIDVERVRVLPDADTISERFFSATEREALRCVPADERPAAFFRCWTRKEAYIKAIGDGLSAPLESFDVSLAPDTNPRLLRIGDDRQVSRRWSMWHLEPAPGFAGAMACEAVGLQVRLWRWPTPR